MNFNSKNNLITLTLLTSAMALMSCSKPHSSVSDQSNGLPGNIIGGKLADADFQKKNGVVGLVIVADASKSKAPAKAAADAADPSEPKDGAKPEVSMAICTGSLIGPRLVLTAAHCLIDPGLRNIGVVFTTDIEKATKNDVIFAAGIKVNRAFNPNTDDDKVYSSGHAWNDIGLVILQKDAPADFHFATLPEADAAPLTKKDTLTFAGYGVVTPLVNKIVVDPKTGKKTVQPLPTSGDGTLRYVDKIQILEVAADNKEILLDQKGGTRGACHGDSGGPAYLKNSDGSFTLVGITSRGTNLIGNCDKQNVYTGVVGYLDWIKAQSAPK